MPIGDYETLRAAASTPDLSAAQALSALELLRELRAELADWEPRLIATARDHGASWADLAPALGVASRQAAERRYLRLRTSDIGESTGEERVRAERDRRAGDRAVSQWARANSAVLRSLAGQIGDLDPSVHRALGENDAAALLSPLAGAHDHLRTTHPDLADRIGLIGEHTDRVRRDTQTQREERGPR
ncbi:HSP18 transcriptional regulator [Umezawaea sp.]|uniref:HSP18 transcriptional regulator n=1 Tax=Umezawaea sp. TaxID=1955258 RepID=UPI002ED0C42F